MMRTSKSLPVSVGIFCHNEENNIRQALEATLASQTHSARIKEIVVVSSGSFDLTNRIVTSFMKKDKRIKLIDEAERNGKSSAVNLFIRQATGQVLICLSGDVRPKKDAIEEISLPFLNPTVGMVGAHPVPMNTRFSQVGREAKLLWELHHHISLKQAKCGEMVAFRNVIHQIPVNSAVDEATLEVLLRLIGFSVTYAPRAIVYNKVPLTLREYIMIRRRVEAGHLWLSEHYKYRVVTLKQDKLLQVVMEYLEQHPQDAIVMGKLVMLELLSRTLGWLDYTVFGNNPYIWSMAKR